MSAFSPFQRPITSQSRPMILDEASPASDVVVADTESDISSEFDPNKLHPLFSSSEADTILGAKCGSKLFRVHSFTLKTTSGWFRTMFSLPQRANSSSSSDIIFLDEDVATLEALLRMICGQPVMRLESMDTVEAILYAAEKYDMPGPMSIGQLLMSLPFSEQPLRLYAVARRYNWIEEAKSASTETLKLNVHAHEHRASLRRLNTDALLDLIELHRERREKLRVRLDLPPFLIGGTAVCTPCGWRLDYHTWRELKYKMILEMDIRPLGDTIVNRGLSEWFEAQACWTAKCTNPECSQPLYDKHLTISTITAAIDELRSSI